MAASLTKEALKELAFSQGLDLVGVANIERFENAPPRMHPAAIFPEARSVIVVARRIIRGNWRGIEEGTHWPNYTYFGYHGLLNTLFIPAGVYETACFIEDHGWEAVPYYPGVPETQPPIEPLRPGAVAPNVHLAIRIAATAAGLGECGWSKVFLTKRFDRASAWPPSSPIWSWSPIRSWSRKPVRSVHGVRGCSSDAIPHRREGKVVRIQIEDKVYEGRRR